MVRLRAPTAVELEPGTTLAERYLVETPISSGAMGAVYCGRDQASDEPVAIKCLLDPRNEARFAIEARLLEQLSHPRVVRVLDHFQDEERMYVVMELVEGIDLRRLVRERGRPGLPLEQSVEYTRQACEALEYVHRQQIVHRDVKPANLILGAHGVVLVDFGVARELDPESTGTVGIGTPRFMAPEVLVGGEASPRSDVFGLAATLWNLIIGRPPAYQAQAEIHLDGSRLGHAVEEALRAGLELTPERRLSSAGAFANALGSPLGTLEGRSLALSVEDPAASAALLEAIVRTAAGIFEAASVSIALRDAATGELVYQAAWGTGARDIVGVRLPAGAGIAGAVVEGGRELLVPDCRKDQRFASGIAAGTGYVPTTLFAVPLEREGEVIGVLSILDRRDGSSYQAADVARARLFADLVLTALNARGDADAVQDLTRAATRTAVS